MACTSGEDATTLYIYCSDIYIIPNVHAIYFSIVAITTILLMWKGIKITTLPIFILFLTTNLILFMRIINFNTENLAFIDYREFRQYRAIDKATGTYNINTTATTTIATITLHVYTLAINFLSTIVYGLRYLFMDRIRSYV